MKTTIIPAILLFSTLSFGQSNEKAFENNSKLVGLNINSGWSKYSGFSRGFGATYEQAVNGTNGILSIGVFSYYKKALLPNYKADSSMVWVPNIKDGDNSKIENFGLGVSLAAHYALKRWDFYAGLRLGADYQHSKFFDLNNGKKYNYGSFSPILAPFAGARYYVSKSISLQLEGDYQRGLTLGISKKFN
jgi:hypothetical protein